MNRITARALLLIGVVFLSGCAALSPAPDRLSPEAQQLLEQLAGQNSRLSAFKGLGDLTLAGAAGRHALGLAWLVRIPDKMRFELLAVTGTPVLSLAADGEYVYWLPHTPDSAFHKLKQKRLNLEKLIGVPVQTDEIMLLLAGRIPVRRYDTAELVRNDDGRRELRLKKNWRGEVQRIHFAGDNPHPVKIEFLTDFGRQVGYSVTIEDLRPVDEFTVPHEMIFAAGPADSATLRIRRYWTGVNIDDAVFVLTDKAGQEE